MGVTKSGWFQPSLRSRRRFNQLILVTPNSNAPFSSLVPHEQRDARVYNQSMNTPQRLPYLWDYDLDQNQFQEILEGRRTMGRLNQDWAARRLLEYAPYEEIVRLIGFKRLVENWPRWRGKIRSKSRVRGFDFLVQWLPEKHPELLHG
jgi:hypothetical protein